VELH
jgi:hypothetical protein